MMANPQAFAAMSQRSAAMATLASNQKAFAALAAQPNLAALMANPSFSAALNQAASCSRIPTDAAVWGTLMGAEGSDGRQLAYGTLALVFSACSAAALAQTPAQQPPPPPPTNTTTVVEQPDAVPPPPRIRLRLSRLRRPRPSPTHPSRKVPSMSRRMHRAFTFQPSRRTIFRCSTSTRSRRT